MTKTLDLRCVQNTIEIRSCWLSLLICFSTPITQKNKLAKRGQILFSRFPPPPKKIILGVKRTKFRKTDSHHVPTAYHFTSFGAFHLHLHSKMRLPQTCEVWPIFGQKLRVVTSQNRSYLEHFPSDSPPPPNKKYE